ILESRQHRDVWFLPRERLKLLLLSRGFLYRPRARRVASDRFDAPRSRSNGLFFHDTERPNLAREPDMCATAKLHLINIKRARSPADLQYANLVAVFLPEKLNDVFPLFCLRKWNFSPRNCCILGNFFVPQFFHVALLLRRERRTRKVER